jgi:hypothetical protein
MDLPFKPKFDVRSHNLLYNIDSQLLYGRLTTYNNKGEETPADNVTAD